MPIRCAALMCHAPIVIPSIAGGRAERCRATTGGMHGVATTLAALEPDVLVLVDPHAPRKRGAFGVHTGEYLAGDFGRFGHPGLRVRADGSPAVAERVRACAQGRAVRTHALRAEPLEHGAMVPLWFLQQAGLGAPVVLVSLPLAGGGSVAGECELMGRAIADAARADGKTWVLLASGDMSHRLAKGAPAGHHPRAAEFDAAFVEAVRAGDLVRACQPDPGLQALAAEDVVDSCRVVAAACDFQSAGHRVLSYEGPFGVGYMEAILWDASAREVRDELGPALLRLARAAVREASGTMGEPAPTSGGPEHLWAVGESRGVFVTLRDSAGGLRGCVGHVDPLHPTLADEVVDCARAAATRDPRFSPVGSSEVAGLHLEVSLLSSPEPVTDRAALDPGRYGVLVSDGRKRGVLLPGIEGVDSVDQQLAIAARKAGLSLGPDTRIERFLVSKYAE